MFNHYFMEFTVTAKKIRVPDAVMNEKLNPKTPIKPKNSYALNEPELKENISRLSQFSNEQIGFSMILSYLKLFMRKRSSHIIFLSFLMIGVSFLTHIMPLIVENPTPIKNVIFQSINIAITSFIGIMIIRLAILNPKDSPHSNVLKGYITLIMVHVIANVAMIITLFIINYVCHKLDNTVNILSYKFLVCGTFVASVISSTILARFCLMIPAIIADNDDIFQRLLLKTNPYFKFLFILFFCAKMICLSSLIFVDHIQSDTIMIIAKTLLFTIYHIFIYVLIGICYKLLIKNNHS